MQLTYAKGKIILPDGKEIEIKDCTIEGVQEGKNIVDMTDDEKILCFCSLGEGILKESGYWEEYQRILKVRFAERFTLEHNN